MAFVNAPTAVGTIVFRDASGSVAKLQIHIPFGTLAVAALAAMDALRTALLALSDCTVISTSVTYSEVDNAPPAANAGSRVEEKGTFVWRLANGLTTSFQIPAIKDSVLTTSGAVDRTNALIIALDTAVTGAGAIFAGRDGSDITALFAAYQKFRASTPNMLPKDR